MKYSTADFFFTDHWLVIIPEISERLYNQHEWLNISLVYLKFVFKQLPPNLNRLTPQIRALDRGKTENFSPSYWFSG